MNEQAIVSKMHEYLHTATKELCAWLAKMLPRVGEDWWQVCVMVNLSFAQKQYATENGYSKLGILILQPCFVLPINHGTTCVHLPIFQPATVNASGT